MRRNFKSTEEEQDDAFFGEMNDRNGSSSSSSLPPTYNDHEYAMKLQQLYLGESKVDINNASRQRQEQVKKQELKDRELARRIQNEQGSQSYITQNNHIDERKRQEEEDAKLAKALQLEESFQVESNESGVPASHSSRNQGGNTTNNSLIPRCVACNKIATFPLQALGNLYHQECFRCMACHGIIQPNERFAVSTGENGENFPLHKECYSDLYGLKCTVCRETIKGDSNGRVSYIKHPFFEEIMCPKHTNQRKCTGCSRFEPIGSSYAFADLGDADRCVCYACCRSVIVDSNDAKPLWKRILRFFERELKLPIFRGMEDIPVLIVPHDALNSQIQNSNHQGSTQIMTRGLCLSEHQVGLNLLLPRLRFDKRKGSFLPSDAESRGHTYYQIPDASKTNPNSNVTAILCLTGLPADLSVSVLAHEATHAWIKLHPSYDPTRPIPAIVEEGCCQLVAMLFLNDGLEKASSRNNGDEPSDEKLRQYFKFSIETDTNEVYGEGYRKAAKVYSEIGIEALLSHVVNYREFPNI